MDGGAEKEAKNEPQEHIDAELDKVGGDEGEG